MNDILLGALISIGVKFVADLGVRLSKNTKNSVDDIIFESLAKAVNVITPTIKNMKFKSKKK